ncbi:MAG: tRNA pseudouridine(55) synthase TruB [bacterium]|nr:tRNA pseudouridine(55) synthase TruB [bacterium]MDA1024476.1 tRNA pseudouridine(55) synthase TruB [bacterium]
MEQKEGFLLINKPAGITSHDVVDKLRKIIGIKKIGHAGTLDPFATGLLLMAIGRGATKRISEFVGLPKTYRATFVLGETTETLDTEKEVVQDPNWNNLVISDDHINEAITGMIGPSKQIPPMYSAIKKGGKKLYELAREGKEIVRDARPITIHRFQLLQPAKRFKERIELEVELSVSSGTYVRAIARDLAEKLGTTGYTSVLHRTAIDQYSIDRAINLQELTSDNWHLGLFEPQN